ncbi:MAG: DNA polymerase I [Candidatus Omnitrophica bacterium]|nr:DNA polymerase I [Candidatus Omnitrophota bacterium]
MSTATLLEQEPTAPPRGTAQTAPVLLLVDGTALAYQSFFALQNLRNPAGQPTGAVFGFYQTIQSLREEYRPDFLAVVMDRGTPVERTEAFADYKAGRAPTPTDLLEQLPMIEELMTTLGVSVLSREGIEADDILAVIAREAAGKGMEVFIHSPDKDMLQVVEDRIRVIRRHGNNTKIYDAEAVRERYGCPPELFPDLLGLMGDSVDNIPGVPGIGEKTAAALLAEHGSLNKVLESADKIKKPKLRESLLAHREQALLSRDLATLNTNLDLEVQVEDLRPVEPDWANAARLFRQFGFRRATLEAEERLLQTGRTPSGDEVSSQAAMPFLAEETSEARSSPTTDYRLVSGQRELEELATLLRSEHPFGLDTETTGVDPHSAGLVGICIGLTRGRGWYLPIAHREGANLDLALVREILGPILADREVGKIGHHLKYDARILERHGLPVKGWVGDTMVLAHLLHTRMESLKLDDLAMSIFGRRMIPIGDLIGEKKGEQITMDLVSSERVGVYGAEDAEVTVALHNALAPELDAQGVKDWYRNAELPLAEILMRMEAKGVKIDPKVLKVQAGEVEKIIEGLRAEVFSIAGREFNPNSTQQLAKILFDERGVPAGKNRSTRQEVLEDLARAGEPLAEKIIEFRQAAKLKGTYLDALPQLIDPCDGRVHTSYNSTVANTGRISSSSPNLQNIPIRTDLGRRVREAFIAEEGHVFVAADYSQIELRVLAHFSRDPGFIQAFNEGQDIHAFTASQVFDVPIGEVTKDMRRKAKEINFGLNYGMSSFGLASRLGIGRSEAKVFMDRYFARYPSIRRYFDSLLEAAERDGYVTTLVGRRIEVQRPRSGTGAEARVALNAPIQGSAADILKKAMVDLGSELEARQLRAAMVLTVHDEIILETPEAEVEEVRELLPRVMTSAVPLSVPVEVDVRVGKSWAALG